MKRSLPSLLPALALVAGCGAKIHDVAAPTIAASADEELIARGEYLFHGAAHCSACHNTKEVGTGIKGGDKPLPVGGGVWKMGPIGTLYSPNLTPDPETGIGDLSDGELARVLRHGVLPDGKLSFFMKVGVGKLADDDVQALISYMRTLQPKKNEVPRSEMSLLANMLVGGAPPRSAGPQKAPPMGVTLERGKYLAEGPANCVGCHSAMDIGNLAVKPGSELAGGEPMASELDDDPHRYVPPNLTPDPETGIAGKWSEEQFLARFAVGRLHRGSPMPWGNYQSVHEDDLKAVWLYLRSVPPVTKDTGDIVIAK